MRTVLFSFAIALSVAAPATAQTWPERVHISVNGAFQPTANDFTDRFEFERDLETGSTEVDYPVQGGFVFDAGAGYRFWKNLAAGVSVSYFTRDDAASTTSSFPHPFFFNQPREVTGEATGVKRSETAVHVQLMYLVNRGGRLRFVLSGGPSYFTVEQDLVTEVTITETFPVRHGDVRLGAEEPQERLGGRLQRRRRRHVDAESHIRRGRAGALLARVGRSRRAGQPHHLRRRRRRLRGWRDTSTVLSSPIAPSTC